MKLTLEPSLTPEPFWPYYRWVTWRTVRAVTIGLYHGRLVAVGRVFRTTTRMIVLDLRLRWLLRRTV